MCLHETIRRCYVRKAFNTALSLFLGTPFNTSWKPWFSRPVHRTSHDSASRRARGGGYCTINRARVSPVLFSRLLTALASMAVASRSTEGRSPTRRRRRLSTWIGFGPGWICRPFPGRIGLKHLSAFRRYLFESPGSPLSQRAMSAPGAQCRARGPQFFTTNRH
jgi:hypothetical protein